MAEAIYIVAAMLPISAPTRNVPRPGDSVLGGSEVISAEVKKVVDLIVG